MSAEHAKNRINLNPLRRIIERSREHPRRHLAPYVSPGQVAADVGCNTGYYTLALADCVGPEGKVYVVDLDKDLVREVQQQAEEDGYENIEARATSAADLGFIDDSSVDFVLANGLL